MLHHIPRPLFQAALRTVVSAVVQRPQICKRLADAVCRSEYAVRVHNIAFSDHAQMEADQLHAAGRPASVTG